MTSSTRWRQPFSDWSIRFHVISCAQNSLNC